MCLTKEKKNKIKFMLNRFKISDYMTFELISCHLIEIVTNQINNSHSDKIIKIN